MKKILLAVVILAILAVASIFSAAVDLPPVPPIPDKFKNIQIAKPDPAVPKEIAAFLGEWEGVVMGKTPFRKVKIIIYEVSTQKIKFLYGCGDNPLGSRFPGGWSDNESELSFSNEKYRFSRRTSSGFSVHYYFENGLLNGMESAGSGRTGYSYELKKVK
ncbi:MAG: hypothetical protein C4567_17855 [Deltaproteobacteria bacterium]|nr:MAG: hypothetical protein C4567_17855 [Deltaproteobacteria bacterium]